MSFLHSEWEEKQVPVRYILGISGGVSFFTYLPTTPSLIVLRSLFFFDSMLRVGLTGNEIETSNRREVSVTQHWDDLTYQAYRESRHLRRKRFEYAKKDGTNTIAATRSNERNYIASPITDVLNTWVLWNVAFRKSPEVVIDSHGLLRDCYERWRNKDKYLLGLFAHMGESGTPCTVWILKYEFYKLNWN